MRGVTGEHINIGDVIGIISTHTPHARRDWTLKNYSDLNSYFNSHASCEA